MRLSLSGLQRAFAILCVSGGDPMMLYSGRWLSGEFLLIGLGERLNNAAGQEGCA